MPELSPEITIPSGLRRFTLTMLSVRDQADQFKGVPRGSGKPFRYLAAFQEAEPYLGLPPQAYKLLAWLVKQTMAHDWEEGSRPICWPSAARQAEFLRLSPARVKTLNRALYEAGIFILRDSETGKRYGRRDPEGRIIEAFGFDLSPLAYRCDEFIRIAAEAKAEREQMKGLRKRATRARRAIRQIGETLATLNAVPPEWPQLAAETAALVKFIRPAERSEALAGTVEVLESLKTQAESWVREVPRTMETSPLGLANEPHTISTNKPSDLKHTVTAAEEGSRGGERVRSSPSPSLSSPTQTRLRKFPRAPSPSNRSRRFIPANYWSWPRVWPPMSRRAIPIGAISWTPPEPGLDPTVVSPGAIWGEKDRETRRNLEMSRNLGVPRQGQTR